MSTTAPLWPCGPEQKWAPRFLRASTGVLVWGWARGDDLHQVPIRPLQHPIPPFFYHHLPTLRHVLQCTGEGN